MKKCFYRVLRVCMCLPFNTISTLSYPLTAAVSSDGGSADLLLGNTRLQRSDVTSSGTGWRSTVGDDSVAIYNPGPWAAAPGVNQCGR